MNKNLIQGRRGGVSWQSPGLWHRRDGSAAEKATAPLISAVFSPLAVFLSGSCTLTSFSLVQDQEQGGSITGLPYWEGACDVLNERGEVIGRAFLELAGYVGDLRKYLGGK